MLEELTPNHITDFKGLFSRGPDEVCPSDHLGQADNIRYINGGIETRYGTSISIPTAEGIRRFFPYSIEGQSDRIIYLNDEGEIYDSLYPTPILTIVGMQDFSMIVLNDRAYLSPHNGVTGLPGEVVYLYQGSGVSARPAAGNGPSGFTLEAAQSPLAGNVEAGFRLFAVAYETDSGFITRPGPAAYASYTGVDGFQVRIDNIQPGPAGTIARHILATQLILDYDGNQDGPELFFVEDEFGGVIADNVTTTKDVNFYDVQLIRSAEYLKEAMTTIPAVLGFTKFAGSLVGWAPNEEPSSVYLSKVNEPENISLIEGGIEVDPTTGGGVKNCVEYRGAALIIHKSGRAYTTSNNGEEPAFWRVDGLDSAIGTEVFGVAAILDEEGNTVDRYVLASRKGLIAYSGNYDNVLSRKIDDVWKRITKTAFNKIQVVLDPINEFISVAVPLDGATSPNAILYCDYQRGLDPDSVRWAIWTFPYDPTSIGIDVDENARPVFKIGSIDGDIYYLDSAADGDNLEAIPQPTFRTGYVGNGEVAVNYFGGIRLRAKGSGSLALQFSGLDDVITVNPPSLLLSSNPGRLLQREFNVSSQMGRLKAWTSNYGDWFSITRISIYSSAEFVEEPE